MSKLPNAEFARVDERKITHYLLATGHPDGHDKAVFFRHFGFRQDVPAVSQQALLDHARTATLVTAAVTDFGSRYMIEGVVKSPDGRNPVVRSVWIIDAGEEAPRLVTAYRGGRK